MFVPDEAMLRMVFSDLTHRESMRDAVDAEVLTLATTTKQLSARKHPLWLSVHIRNKSSHRKNLERREDICDFLLIFAIDFDQIKKVVPFSTLYYVGFTSAIGARLFVIRS